MRVIAPFAIALSFLLLIGVWWGRPTPGLRSTRVGSIQGQVVDDQGPVAGASVRIKGTAQQTVSGKDGRFVLASTKASRSDRKAQALRPDSKAPDAGQDRIVVTAAKQGYYIQGVEVADGQLRIQLVKLPIRDNPDYQWISPHPDPAGSHNCANCHEEIYREWQSSGHAGSAKNRRLRSLISGTAWNGKRKAGWSMAGEYPEGIGVCSSCHLPSAETAGDGQFDLRLAKGVHADGVHCDYCHKIQSIGLTDQTLGWTHGRFGVRLLRPKSGQLFFGPLDDVDRGEDAFSKVQSESIYCASCHEGTLFGVRVYTTYSEWLKSPAFAAGRTCQSCHMRPTGRMTNVASDAGGLERDPQTLSSHSFLPGGRLAMLRSALQVAVKWSQADDQGWRAEVRLKARNVGHRVPTGFIDRHLILIADPLDAERRPLSIVAGPRLGPLAGDFATRPGRLFGRVLRDERQQSPSPFWRPAVKQIDTRLQPDQAVVTTFRFSAATKMLRVRVVYRRFWYSVARQKEWPDDTLKVLDREFPVGAPTGRP